MLETLFSSTVGDAMSLLDLLSVLGASLVLGLLISLVYIRTHKAEGYSSGFTITLIMLPAIISVIILLIGNNVARAFSLAGAFSLIRFRSAPGDPKDIAYIFFTLGVGLACGMGYLAYAVVFALILCLVMAVLQYSNFTRPRSNHMQLKIMVPENLNFQGLFDDVLGSFTDSWNLKRIKTTDFGTLFELVYTISLKAEADRKKFIDELRCRNGNHNISLTLEEYEEKYSA